MSEAKFTARHLENYNGNEMERMVGSGDYGGLDGEKRFEQVGVGWVEEYEIKKGLRMSGS